MRNKEKMKIILKKSEFPSRLLFFWLMEMFFMTVARYILSTAGIETGPLRNIVLVLVASMPLILFFFHIKDFKVEQYLSCLILYLLIFWAFIFTFILHPEYEYFFMRSGYGIERVLRPDCAIYAYLFFSLINDPDKIYETIKKYAIIDFTYLVVVQLLPAMIRGYWVDVDYLGRQVVREYSLSLGYSILLPTIIFLYMFIQQKNIIYLFLSFIGMGIIFLYASRGALLMIVIFVGLMAISAIVESKKISYKILKILGILLLIIIICIWGQTLLTWAVQLLQSMGIESRSLDLLVQGEFTNDSGRNTIWNAVINGIREGGLLGYGVFGDRPFVYPIHYVAYSHNIFLELIASFGILGVGIILFLCINSFRMIFFCKDRRWRELFIIFFSVSCQLIISMSFWYVMEFWAAIAIAHRYFKIERKAIWKTKK